MTEARKRGRPKKDVGEKEAKLDHLDQLEQRAVKRVKAGRREPARAQSKLDIPDKDPNFKYLWVSDRPDAPITLQGYLNAGWTFVRYEHGDLKGERRTAEGGRGMTLYAMMQPVELFQEDEKIKHEKAIKQHNEINNVGEREYAGESKEIGKGKVAQLDITENPAANILRQMEG